MKLPEVYYKNKKGAPKVPL